MNSMSGEKQQKLEKRPVSFHISEDVISRVDNRAESLGISRSALIKEAVLRYLYSDISDRLKDLGDVSRAFGIFALRHMVSMHEHYVNLLKMGKAILKNVGDESQILEISDLIEESEDLLTELEESREVIEKNLRGGSEDEVDDGELRRDLNFLEEDLDERFLELKDGIAHLSGKANFLEEELRRLSQDIKNDRKEVS